MSDYYTLHSQLNGLIDALKQRQEIEVEYEGNQITTNIDARNFSRLFLSPHAVTTFNQYGGTETKFVSYYVNTDMGDDEIPHYDDNDHYQENPGDPSHLPPENSGTTTWADYDTIRCEVAHKFVKTLVNAWNEVIDLFNYGYQAAEDLVKIIVDALLDIFLAGSAVYVVATGGAGAVAIPIGVIAKVLVQLISWASKILRDTAATTLKTALADAQDALICSIYQNRAPSAIKQAWDSTIDDEIDGIVLWPMRAILKHLLPNRHATLLAEGIGKREWGATCAGCGPQLAERYLFDSEDRPENPYHRIWPDQHVPPFVVAADRADKFLHQGWEKRYKVGSYFDGTIVFWWQEFEGGPAIVRNHGKSEHSVFHVFPEPCFSYLIYRPSQYNFGFSAEIWTTT